MVPSVGWRPVSGLTNDQLTVALAVLAIITLLCLVTTILLGLRLKSIHRRLAVMRGQQRDVDVLSAVGRTADSLRAVSQRVEALESGLAEEEEQRRLAFQRFGLVRYDAFAEMGGQLSFSAALLDDHGDGIIITSINGRTETRTYAKAIRGGESSQSLSHEEREAIEHASSGEMRSIATVSH